MVKILVDWFRDAIFQKKEDGEIKTYGRGIGFYVVVFYEKGKKQICYRNCVLHHCWTISIKRIMHRYNMSVLLFCIYTWHQIGCVGEVYSFRRTVGVCFYPESSAFFFLFVQFYVKNNKKEHLTGFSLGEWVWFEF